MEPRSELYRLSRGASRLKQASLDPLESIGLPSKGDSRCGDNSTICHADTCRRLLNPKTQEDYFKKVLDRYERYLVGGNNDALDAAFSSLSLDGLPEDRPRRTEKTSQKRIITNAPRVSIEQSREACIILMAMRKVREAIVASGRKDAFAIRAYVFIIRATILMRHLESYHPALLHLLRHLHTVTPLTASEHHEFVGLYVLDLSCRQNDLATAYKVGCHYKYKNEKVERVLKALVHGNWYAFWKIKPLMSDYQQRLLEYAEQGMRRRALDCLGRSYLSVDREFLERSAKQQWEQLKSKFDVDWKLEADVVVIRQIKRK